MYHYKQKQICLHYSSAGNVYFIFNLLEETKTALFLSSFAPFSVQTMNCSLVLPSCINLSGLKESLL